jgi:hypothetical protein
MPAVKSCPPSLLRPSHAKRRRDFCRPTCSVRLPGLFSHKTYIVMPNTIGETDLDRLDALCSLYGIGLVLFEPKPEAPNFQMKLKAQRLEPDMFYVNDFARRLLEADRDEFDRLFG